MFRSNTMDARKKQKVLDKLSEAGEELDEVAMEGGMKDEPYLRLWGKLSDIRKETEKEEDDEHAPAQLRDLSDDDRIIVLRDAVLNGDLGWPDLVAGLKFEPGLDDELDEDNPALKPKLDKITDHLIALKLLFDDDNRGREMRYAAATYAPIYKVFRVYLEGLYGHCLRKICHLVMEVLIKMVGSDARIAKECLKYDVLAGVLDVMEFADGDNLNVEDAAKLIAALANNAANRKQIGAHNGAICALVKVLKCPGNTQKDVDAIASAVHQISDFNRDIQKAFRDAGVMEAFAVAIARLAVKEDFIDNTGRAILRVAGLSYA